MNNNNKETAPTVSIVIPTYNSEKTVARAIESVLQQTYTDYEMIIVDDASTDGTVAIVESYISDGAPIQLHQLESNSGAGMARSRGLSVATGEYVALLDADDFWFRNKLQTQTQHMAAGADVCFNSYLRLTIHGQYYGVSEAAKTESLKTMVMRNGLGTSSVIFRRDLNGASEMAKIRTRQDYAFWLKLLKSNELNTVGLQDVLSVYVVGGSSISANPVENLKMNYRMFSNIIGYSAVSSGIFVLMNIFFKVLVTLKRYLSIARMKRGHSVFDLELLAEAKRMLLVKKADQQGERH